VSERTCKTCGIQHDPVLHRAVLNVRRWLRSRTCELPPRPPSAPKPTAKRLQNILVRGSGRP
jgi:hypothetical protein